MLQTGKRHSFIAYVELLSDEYLILGKLDMHQTSTVQLLTFANGLVISSHTLLSMWLLNHAGIKVNPC